MTDAKEWVTTKVPKEDRDTANDLKPEDATYGDCLVAGARVLSISDGFGIPRDLAGLEDAPPEVQEDVEELLDNDPFEASSPTWTDRDVSFEPFDAPDIDPDAIAREVAAQIDYAHLADKTATEVLNGLR